MPERFQGQRQFIRRLPDAERTRQGAAGGGFNTVLLSNAVLKSSAANFVGNYTTNNVMTLLNSTWNLGNAGLTVGAGVITKIIQ